MGSLWVLHLYGVMALGFLRGCLSLGAGPSSFCQQNRITSVCCGIVSTSIHTYIYMYIYPQFMPHNNTSSRQCSSISTLHFTCPCHPLQTALWPQATPPPFTSTHILPIFSRASPDFSHLPTCWTFVTVLALAVHQAAVAAVRLTHNLQNNLNPPTQSRIPAPRWKTASLPRRGPSLSHSVSRLGECVNCLV